jgi:hypothetical protein
MISPSPCPRYHSSTKARCIFLFSHPYLSLVRSQVFLNFRTPSLESLGIPEPDVKWFREGNMLQNGQGGFQIRKICNGKWNLFVNQERFQRIKKFVYIIPLENVIGISY